MVHKFELQKNPQVIGAIAFSVILAALGVAAVFVLDDPWSVVALVLLLAAAFQLMSRIRKALRSYVELDEDGVRGVTADGQQVEMLWSDMNVCGVAVDEKGFKSVFCYDEDADKYLQLPQLYKDFETLARRFTDKPGSLSWTLSKGETIQSRLRSLVISTENQDSN